MDSSCYWLVNLRRALSDCPHHLFALSFLFRSKLPIWENMRKFERGSSCRMGFVFVWDRLGRQFKIVTMENRSWAKQQAKQFHVSHCQLLPLWINRVLSRFHTKSRKAVSVKSSGPSTSLKSACVHGVEVMSADQETVDLDGLSVRPSGLLACGRRQVLKLLGYVWTRKLGQLEVNWSLEALWRTRSCKGCRKWLLYRNLHLEKHLQKKLPFALRCREFDHLITTCLLDQFVLYGTWRDHCCIDWFNPRLAIAPESARVGCEDRTRNRHMR